MMYNDQLVYQVVIWSFFGISVMKRKGSFKTELVLSWGTHICKETLIGKVVKGCLLYDHLKKRDTQFPEGTFNVDVSLSLILSRHHLAWYKHAM